MKRQCFRCDGTGNLCDLCGESEIACKCFDEGKEPTYSDCNECGGEGKIDAAKAKGKKV